MPTTTYIIRFAPRYRPTSVPYEEQEHTNLADAWEAYRLLTEPTSAEVYSQIELVEYNYAEDTERMIVRIEFSFLIERRTHT